MVARPNPLYRLLGVLLVCVVGCADLNSWRSDSKRVASERLPRRPSAAPALLIPGADEPAAHTQVHQATLELATETEPVAEMPALVPVCAEQRQDDLAFAKPLAALWKIQRQGAAHVSTLDGYVARLRRREVINGKQRPEELLLVKFRTRPWSIYLKWLGDEAHGRQAVYVEGQHDDALHVLPGKRDGLFKATRHLKLALDSTWVRANNRHSLAELGVGPAVKQFGEALSLAERSPDPTLRVKDLGELKRPEFEQPVRAVLQIIPPRIEDLLPRGGQRLWFFDKVRNVPLLLITHDHAGQEVEYFCWEELRPATFSDADFDPHVLQ